MCLGQQTKSQLSSAEKYNSWIPKNPMNTGPGGLCSMAWVSSWVTVLTLGGIAQYAGS